MKKLLLISISLLFVGNVLQAMAPGKGVPERLCLRHSGETVDTSSCRHLEEKFKFMFLAHHEAHPECSTCEEQDVRRQIEDAKALEKDVRTKYPLSQQYIKIFLEENNEQIVVPLDERVKKTGLFKYVKTRLCAFLEISGNNEYVDSGVLDEILMFRKRQENKKRMLAFCMARHPRLGAESPASVLPELVWRRIYDFLIN